MTRRLKPCGTPLFSPVVASSCTAIVRPSGFSDCTRIRNGTLAAGAFADAIGRVLDDPPAYRPLGDAAAALVRERYALDVCVPEFQRLFADARATNGVRTP